MIATVFTIMESVMTLLALSILIYCIRKIKDQVVK